MRLMPWLGVLARLVAGVAFLWAGLAKVGDLAGSGRAVALYQIVSGEAARLIGAELPFVEIALGILLLIGLGTRVTALMTACLLVVYLAAIASVWARGLSISCGCFGGAGTVSSGAAVGYLMDILRDTVLLIAVGYLAWRPVTRYGLDRRVLAVGES